MNARQPAWISLDRIVADWHKLPAPRPDIEDWIDDQDPHRLIVDGLTPAHVRRRIDWHQHKLDHALFCAALLVAEDHPAAGQHALTRMHVEHHRRIINALKQPKPKHSTDLAARNDPDNAKARARAQLRKDHR